MISVIQFAIIFLFTINFSSDMCSVKDSSLSFDSKSLVITDTIPKDSLRSVPPRFPGCEEALNKSECSDDKLLEFIYTNLKYPGTARKNKTEGLVVSRFTILEDGSISDIKIIRSLSEECDREVIRIIEKMPKWIPRMINGKKVDVMYTLPVKFRLS